MKRKTINPAPQTPNSEDREGQGHYFTPTQIKVRDPVQFCERMSIDYVGGDVFQTFNVSTYQGHEFLRNKSSLHQLHNDPNQKKTRRRPRVISAEKLREMERILQEERIEPCVIT